MVRAASEYRYPPGAALVAALEGAGIEFKKENLGGRWWFRRPSGFRGGSVGALDSARSPCATAVSVELYGVAVIVGDQHPLQPAGPAADRAQAAALQTLSVGKRTRGWL